ncbi:glycosyltransferase family 4 protein [Candidatus Pelagibacter sp.]|uniref:glycosyltransferase family 4 protein n=1 Tax=Candidatus Pelagibacter sp. TaxID=2024849 RepID=UPI003F87AB7F
MNILIEGWRGINHSFSLVNQWQILELLKISNIFFKDIPFISDRWNVRDNASGFEDDNNNLINNISPSMSNEELDITYRISFPFNFDSDFKSKLLFVFGNCEYKKLNNNKYKNDIPERLSENEKFFIHTPSYWSKEGFLNAGFRNDQIIVVPHGVDVNLFNLTSPIERNRIRAEFNLNESDFILSNIGAMTKNKGIEVLIAAYGILKRKFKNLKLILKDQSNLYNFKPNYIIENVAKSELNRKYGIINSETLKDIKIISNNLSLKKIKDIYSITDCYVSPYLAEGFNLTPLEAAACGTRILVTKGGSTDDYFNESMGFQIESDEKKVKESYLLEPKLESLVQILENKIINNTDNSKKIRSELVHKSFSWKVVVNRLFNNFKEKLR